MSDSIDGSSRQPELVASALLAGSMISRHPQNRARENPYCP